MHSTIIEGSHIENNQVFIDVRLRTWHPGFVITLWRILEVKPVVVKPFIVAWLYFIVNFRHSNATN